MAMWSNLEEIGKNMGKCLWSAGFFTWDLIMPIDGSFPGYFIGNIILLQGQGLQSCARSLRSCISSHSLHLPNPPNPPPQNVATLHTQTRLGRKYWIGWAGHQHEGYLLNVDMAPGRSSCWHGLRIESYDIYGIYRDILEVFFYEFMFFRCIIQANIHSSKQFSTLMFIMYCLNTITCISPFVTTFPSTFCLHVSITCILATVCMFCNFSSYKKNSKIQAAITYLVTNVTLSVSHVVLPLSHCKVLFKLWL